MDLELAGRRVLITGAATGIGRSTVQTSAACSEALEFTLVFTVKIAPAG